MVFRIMRRQLFIGIACFLLGALGLALADTAALRPEVFIARAWTWTGIQSFADGKLILNGASSGSSTVKAPATGGGTVTLPSGTVTLLASPVALSSLATETANTVVANVSGSTAAPTAASLPSCADSGGNHLNYTNGSGFSCGTSTSAGGGSVNSGTGGRLAWYATTGTVIDGNADATISSGDLTLGITTGPVAGSVKMWGSTSGSLQVKPAAAAGTGSVLTLPGGTTDFSATGGAGQLVKQATSGGALTVGTVACAGLSDGATGCSTATGTSGATLPLLNAANTWSAVQTFTNSDIALLGSSTGKTTFTSANAGASNYTLTTQAATGTVALLDVADQTVAGGANVTSLSLGTISSGTTTIDCGARPLQYFTNGGAFTLAAPASDGSCLVMSTNNGSASTITFSGFTVGSSTGDALTTTNAEKFTISIWRINGVAGYRVAAMQ